MKQNPIRKLAGAVAIAALCGGISACDYLPTGFTPVGEVVAQPASFEGKEIKLKGKVTRAWKLPLIGTRLYTLADGHSAITVVTEADLPGEGDKIAIRGKVQNAAILNGTAMGTTVQEITRLPGSAAM